MVLSKRQGEQEQDVSGTGYVLFEFVNADVVEQVDTGDLKSSGLSRAGSSPVIRTIRKQARQIESVRAFVLPA